MTKNLKAIARELTSTAEESAEREEKDDNFISVDLVEIESSFEFRSEEDEEEEIQVCDETTGRIEFLMELI